MADKILSGEHPAPVLIFYHLPKSAGTTMASVLRKEYGSKNVYQVHTKSYEADIENYSKLNTDEKSRYQAISGHLLQNIEPFITRKAIRFTYVRDPIQHFFSSYKYIRTNKNNRFHQEVSRLEGARQFLDWQAENGFDNQQMRYLANIAVRTDENHKKINLQNGGQAYFDRAIELLQSLDFVFVTEKFDEGLLVLKKALMWSSVPYYQSQNVSRKSDSDVSENSSLEQQIKTVNKWDFELYKRAQDIHEAQVSKLGGQFQEELEQFQAQNNSKRHKGKVFVIGLAKTGTTSLSAALELLGYSSIHYPRTFDDIDRFDSASDLFVANNYRELDSKYPGAKFILTTRGEDDWIESLERHIAKIQTPKKGTFAYEMRTKALGSADFNKELMVSSFAKHTQNVKEYFSERREDLLVLKMPEDFKWKPLCDFLDVPIPDESFPVANVNSEETLKTAQPRS